MPAAEDSRSYGDAAHETASGFIAYARSSVDRVVSPDSRERAYKNTASFASDRPFLFSIIVFQLLFAFLPILLFITFSLSTVAFALGAAVLFSLFWIGVALMVLVPTLLVTSSIAVLAWAWAAGSFIVVRWLYEHAPIGGKGSEVAIKQENGS